MKYFIFVLCLLLGVGLFWHLKTTKESSQDFSEFDFFLSKPYPDSEDYHFYKDLYLKNYRLFLDGSKDGDKIPKVLHFVWTGPQPFPIDSLTFLKSWRRNHPGWKIFFWTDDPLRPVPIETLEKRLISEISTSQNLSMGNTKDMMRLIGLEILEKEGGVFVDDTVECYQPFDPLNLSYHFYVALSNDGVDLFPCAKLIGAKAKHPIIQQTLAEIRAHNNLSGSFSNATRALIDNGESIDIAFPTAYFYPSAVFDNIKIKELKKEQLIFADGPTCIKQTASTIKTSISQLFIWSFIIAIGCFGLLLTIFIKKRAL